MTTRTQDIITAKQAKTLYGMFLERVKRSGEKVAYTQYNRATKTWDPSTWNEMADLVARFQAGFRKQGLQPGDRIAILMKNSKEWVAFDMAAYALGLVVVPLYCDDRADNVAYILEDSVTKVLCLEGPLQWQRVAESIPNVQCLEKIIVVEPDKAGNLPRPEDPRMVLLSDWLDDDVPELAPVREDDHEKLASIVYTSGTTGRPKGVMLSHKAMLEVAEASLNVLVLYQEDELLSFLPLSHTFERTGGYYVTMMGGCGITYSRGILQLADDLATIKPTALIGVPRIFERVYGRVQQTLQKGSAIKRFLFKSAVNVGYHRFLRQQGRAGWRPTQIFWPILEKLVAGKIMARLGGNMRIAVAGGAALPEHVAKTFIGLGLPIIQGYGLTETAPVLAVNPLEDNVPESVGKALPGIELKILDNGELIAKTPGRMMGYWNNHAATEEMLMDDGWIHTGDVARISDEGHLYITGRIKDIMVLSNGEKLPPGDMENAVLTDTLFEQVMIIGEGRAYLTAMVTLNPDEWVDLANSKGWDPKDASLLRDKKVSRLITQRLQATLKEFPSYAKVRRVFASLDAWTVENGLLTPTLKVKRQKVAERFANEIDAMYDAVDV